MQRMRPLEVQAPQFRSWALPVAVMGESYQLPRPPQLEHVTAPDPPQALQALGPEPVAGP